MSKSKKCPTCGAELVTKREDYLYDESGLPIMLVGIDVRHCSTCKTVAPLIPNIEGLHRSIARIIIEQKAALSGAEIRFLRTYLGFRATDFASIMGVTKETVSRWENDAIRMGSVADRALRLLVQTRNPVSDYAPEALDALLRNIGEETAAFKLRIERRGGGWAASAAA